MQTKTLTSVIFAALIGVASAADVVTSISFGTGAKKDGNHNISLGVGAGKRALKNGVATDDNVSVGFIADTNGVGNARVCIGTASGGSSNGDRMVLIGAYEHTNQTEYAEGVTSINGKQVYFNKSTGEMALSLDQDWTSLTNALIYYKDGTVHINAALAVDGQDGGIAAAMPMLSTAEGVKAYVDSRTFYSDESVTLASGGFDLYMAPYGNDGNDGSFLMPMATFEGCIARLASSNGGTVCVLPGNYAPVPLQEYGGSESMLYSPQASCTFVALCGNKRTTVTGVYSNTDGYNDGLRHTMAFANRNTKFVGFTFLKINGYRQSADADGYLGTAPAFSCVTLEDCVVSQCDVQFGFCFAAFNTCLFQDSVIDQCSFTGYSQMPKSEVFCNCVLQDSLMKNISVAFTNTASFFGTQTDAYFSCFDLPSVNANEITNDVTCAFSHCTFIWDAQSAQEGIRVSPANAENCYFCVGQNTLASGGISNQFSSVSSTKLDKSYIPASISCPAVYADMAVLDAGWKDSGLSELKALATQAQ